MKPGARARQAVKTKNVPLGVTLGEIRLYKAAGFYQGAVAANIVAYSASAGGGISAGELAATAPLQGAARSRAMRGSFVTWMPGALTGAGAFNARDAGQSFAQPSRHARSAAGAAQTAVGQTLASFGVTARCRAISLD